MRYVIIGSSAAGISAAHTLRELDSNSEIIMISKDEQVYSRCILHHYLDGRRTIEELDFAPRDFFQNRNIIYRGGIEVTYINVKEHNLTLSNGEMLKYDKVLITTGASSFIPPIENLREANNVIGLRNLDDAIFIKEQASKVKNIVVLGAGLVGMDAVSGVLHCGAKITLVEMADRILPLQLDNHASLVYEKKYEEEGVSLKLGVKAEKLIVDENKNPKALLLNTGEEVLCELVIVTTGVRSNIKFIENSGIEVDKLGLIFDPQGRTNDIDVYGAGDVSGRNPIWPTAKKEGVIAAYNMFGEELFMKDFFGSKNTMNFLEIATLSLGLVNKPDNSYEEEIDINEKNYKKIIHKEGKIYGAIIQGNLSYAGVLTQLIKEKIDISKVKKPLFDIDYSDFFNVKENQEYTY